MDSRLSQRGKSHNYALRESAQGQRQSKRKDCILIGYSLKRKSQERAVMGGYVDVKVCIF